MAAALSLGGDGTARQAAGQQAGDYVLVPSASAAVDCDDCDDNHATPHCSECSLNLCGKCCDDHRRRKRTKHHTMDLSSSTSSKSAQTPTTVQRPEPRGGDWRLQSGSNGSAGLPRCADDTPRRKRKQDKALAVAAVPQSAPSSSAGSADDASRKKRKAGSADDASRKKRKLDKVLAELSFGNPGVKAAVAAVPQSAPSSSAGSASSPLRRAAAARSLPFKNNNKGTESGGDTESDSDAYHGSTVVYTVRIPREARPLEKGEDVKRQKCSPAAEDERKETGKGGGAKKAVAPNGERVKKRALTSGRSAAVYSFNDAGFGALPAFQRRDWSLSMVRAVGRTRPPFARTMLYLGTLPSVLESLSQTQHFNQVGLGGRWVVKRWPDSNARKLIDMQVHECIRINPHPHLVRILDVSSTEGVLMDYFEDGDLLTRMGNARRTSVPVAQVLRYLLQLMQGLAHLHALDVVHCDVTPANIFLRGEHDKKKNACSLALGDFGHSYILNKHKKSRSSVAQQGLGAEFVAPEVKAGGPSTKESDIFSAGKILEGLLNLSASFKSEMVVQPKSVLQMLRGLAADMCGVSTRRPTSREVCVRLQSLASQSLR
jgi:hypothetical protein